MSRRYRAHRAPRPRLGVVVPAAGFGTIMVALAAATGKVSYLVEHLPLTPTPNGFTVFVLTLIAGGTWWRLSRIETPAHPQLELPDNEKWPTPEPLVGCSWPDADPDPDPGNPWFGNAPFTDEPAWVPRRPTPVPVEDLTPDPDQAHPTLLPVRAERRVRT